MLVGVPLALAVALAACAGDDSSPVEPDEPAPVVTTATAVSDATSSILIEAFVYVVPATLPAGSMVTVRNEDHADHTVTADDGSFSVFVAGDASDTFIVPTVAGSYPFFCRVHPDMRGELRVV